MLQLLVAVDAQLFAQAFAVGVGGFVADAHCRGGLFQRVALRELQEKFALTCAQGFQPGHAVEIAQVKAQVELAANNGLQCIDQFVSHGVLADVA